MSPAKTTLLFLLIAVASCAAKKQRVFYAFTDGFMDWYKLELYPDKTFDLHVPVIDYTGTYKVVGDTIFLSYDKDTIGHAPIAYLINANQKKVDELDLVDNRYQLRQSDNRWIQIVENRLRE